MKFSSKIEKCGLSPMRKFAPYANEAAKKGKKLYHLNIGQPDIATPAAYRRTHHQQAGTHHHRRQRGAADRAQLHPR